MEPSVSEPTAIGANPAATPAPHPEDEPPGVSRLHWLAVNRLLGGKDLHYVPRSWSWAIRPPRRMVIESVYMSPSKIGVGLNGATPDLQRKTIR